MNDFHLRSATPHDVRALIGLLAEAVPDCSPQTVWSVPWTWPHYRLVFDAEGALAGAGALVEVDASTVELRGLVVSQTHRGRGLATLLVSHLLECTQSSGRRMVCVTKNPRFFQKFGFQQTAPRWLEHDPQRRIGFGARTPSPRVAMASIPSTPTP